MKAILFPGLNDRSGGLVEVMLSAQGPGWGWAGRTDLGPPALRWRWSGGDGRARETVAFGPKDSARGSATFRDSEMAFFPIRGHFSNDSDAGTPRLSEPERIDHLQRLLPNKVTFTGTGGENCNLFWGR